MRGNPLAVPPPPGFEQAHFELVRLVQRGEITFAQAKKRWRRILRRHRKDLTIETYAAHLRRKAVLVRSSWGRTAIRPMVAHGFTRVLSEVEGARVGLSGSLRTGHPVDRDRQTTIHHQL